MAEQCQFLAAVERARTSQYPQCRHFSAEIISQQTAISTLYRGEKAGHDHRADEIIDQRQIYQDRYRPWQGQKNLRQARDHQTPRPRQRNQAAHRQPINLPKNPGIF